MPKTIIRIRDKYLEWSSVMDAPTTYGMSRQQMGMFLLQSQTEKYREEIASRLDRADKNGTSCIPATSVEEAILVNRAGPGESRATLDEIYENYCKDRLMPTVPWCPWCMDSNTSFEQSLQRVFFIPRSLGTELWRDGGWQCTKCGVSAPAKNWILAMGWIAAKYDWDESAIENYTETLISGSPSSEAEDVG